MKKFDTLEAIKERKRNLSKSRAALRNTNYSKTRQHGTAKRRPRVPKLPEKVDIVPNTSNIGVGILSCNRLHCVKRLLESIKKHSPANINVVVSDESTDKTVKEYLRSVDWISLVDHKERRGVVHNTNALLHALIPFRFKIIFNDDVEIKKGGWETFYFNAMRNSGYHHFCYREYNIYGASEREEKSLKVDATTIKTITTKPQGAVMSFDDTAFKYVGYYDHKFPRYGMAHVDWSNRISKSGIQPPGFHDVGGSAAYFKIHPEKTVEEDKGAALKQARKIYDSLNKSGRLFIPPLETYPSKIHVIINTYNRPDLIDLLLSDIQKNRSKHDISVHIYDDGSKANYGPIIKKHKDLEVIYKKLDQNHGKENYWQVVTCGFEDTKTNNAQFFVKLDDDVRLVDGFFDKCIAYWSTISDPKKICMNPLLDELRKGKAVWTGKKPREVTFGQYSYWNSGWVDMMFFCEKKFFEELAFKVNPVPKSRWIKDKTKSSGVGAQLSDRLMRLSLSMYQPGNTLVMHEDHQSQMHADLRKQQPIMSEHADCAKITMSMATIKERVGVLSQVVDSIYDQCDQLNIYINDYDEIPEFLKRDKIITHNGKKLGDIGDVGKFCHTQPDGYIFTIDDDIIYPPNYVSTMIQKINQYNKKCCVGVHGVILKSPVTDYYKCRQCLHYRRAQQKDVPVHIVGTGTLAYHSSTINICRTHFAIPNMADIWFGILAQKKKIGLRCVARPSQWLKDVPIADHSKSIHGRKSTAAHQTKAVKAHGSWRLF